MVSNPCPRISHQSTHLARFCLLGPFKTFACINFPESCKLLKQILLSSSQSNKSWWNSFLRTKRVACWIYYTNATCNLMHNYLAKRPLTLLFEKNCLSRKLPCSFLFLTCCSWSLFFFLRISGYFDHRRGCHLCTFIFGAGPDYYSRRVEWNIIIVGPIVVTNLRRTRSIHSGLNKSHIIGPIVRCQEISYNSWLLEDSLHL